MVMMKQNTSMSDRIRVGIEEDGTPIPSDQMVPKIPNERVNLTDEQILGAETELSETKTAGLLGQRAKDWIKQFLK